MFPVRLLTSVLLPVILASWFAVPVSAQTAVASLTGVVADESGAAVANVTLTLADESRAVQRSAVSDAQGIYHFVAVPPGTYVLTGGSGAFAPVRIAGITLAAGEERTLPVTLKVGPLTDAVSVSAVTGRTASIGKLAQTLREIPQSVSIITRERMDEQNIVTLEDAMAVATGVGAYGNANGAPFFIARGYPLEAQYDGIPGSSSLSNSQFDMALYEQVEVLRGPAGLLQGAGNPSGVINLVRKRAQRIAPCAPASRSGRGRTITPMWMSPAP